MYFPTLNDALAAEGLVHLWPLGVNISYNETQVVHVEDDKVLRHISVYRDERGHYERPIHYVCGTAT